MILDEQSIASSEGVKFRLNQAKKHPDNPVLIPGFPHEMDGLQVSWPSCVVYDPEDGLFRCWYAGREAVQYDVNAHPERRGLEYWMGRGWKLGYAESEDGVHWRKPRLGFHELRGMDTNRCATDYEREGTGIGYDRAWSLQPVWLNPAPESADEKFQALVMEVDSDGQGKISFKTQRWAHYSSPDGKFWTRRGTVMNTASENDEIPMPNVIDAMTVIVDPDFPDPNRRVMVFGQTDVPNEIGSNRGVGRIRAPDLYSLTCDNLEVLFEGDQRYENELHFNTVKKLENGHFVMVHDSSRFSYDGTGSPDCDIRFAASSDGTTWRRIHPDTPIIPQGTRAEFDSNMLVAGYIVEYGDTVHLYYHGTPCYFRPWPRTQEGVEWTYRASNVYPVCMGLATLPRDRYAYAEGPGTITTDPLEMTGGDLWLNADGNGIDLAVVDESGCELAQGKLADETRQTVYRKATWKSPLPDAPAAVRVQLPEGERLYSLQHKVS